MNIETTNKISQTNTTSSTSTTKQTNKSDTSFADTLNMNSAQNNEVEKTSKENTSVDNSNDNTQVTSSSSLNEDSVASEETAKTTETVNDDNENKTEIEVPVEENKLEENKLEENELENSISGLQGTVEEIINIKNQGKEFDINKNDNELENETIAKINNKNDNELENETIAKINNKNDENEEDKSLINNDVNIQEKSDLYMPQMNSGMNFDSNNQSFSEFVNPKENNSLNSSATDLEEENAILSTMSENIAIANKNIAMKNNENTKTNNLEKTTNIEQQNNNEEIIDDALENNVKTVINDEGIKKVDKNTNVTIETVVSYNDVVMTENDVDFFTTLVNEGSIDMSALEETNNQSSQVSKSLADLIAKSVKDNQPVRIDFDNDISVIIKVGKDGKISADFLPSSQVAETYLKENLPLLKQRFDDNNIDYDELNQRKQKQDDNRNENRKKGRKDE